VQTITIGQQTTLDGASVPIRRNRFDRPPSELRAVVEAQQVECFGCEAKGRVGKRMLKVEVYDSPWQEEPTVIYVCGWNRNEDPDDYYEGQSCHDLLYDESFASFRYFDCEGCGRTVIRQCPSNGYHSYVRYDEGSGDEVCLRCYEQEMCTNGLPRSKFADGQIPGMFCDRDELAEHGFTIVEGFDNVRIASQDDADRLCGKAVELIDTGHKVAVDYDSMAIGGSEGYITLYTKNA